MGKMNFETWKTFETSFFSSNECWQWRQRWWAIDHRDFIWMKWIEVNIEMWFFNEFRIPFVYGVLNMYILCIYCLWCVWYTNLGSTFHEWALRLSSFNFTDISPSHTRCVSVCVCVTYCVSMSVYVPSSLFCLLPFFWLLSHSLPISGSLSFVRIFLPTNSTYRQNHYSVLTSWNEKNEERDWFLISLIRFRIEMDPRKMTIAAQFDR